jgi:ADP-ribosylation factor protein 6
MLIDTLCVTPSSAMAPAEVTEKLGLHRMRDRSWFVHPSCATSGEVSDEAKVGRGALRLTELEIVCWQGLFEGLSWLSNNVKTQAPRT